MTDQSPGTADPRANRDLPLFLTVDDEPAINWALGRLIRKSGFEVDHALNAQAAIDLCRGRSYGVVFVDAKLPDMSGPVLAERLRAMLQDPVIVLISGYYFDDDPVVDKALQDGLIAHFVSKPFLHGDILALIKRITGTSAS